MVTRTYQEGASGPPYGETAGVRLITALEGAGTDPFTALQAAREGATLGLTRTHTIRLLHLLAVGGWITHVKKGVYAINDPVTKAPRAHPFAIGAALVSPWFFSAAFSDPSLSLYLVEYLTAPASAMSR